MIKKQIFLRGVCEKERKSLPVDECSAGIYCASRLRLDESAAALVIALGKRDSFTSELLHNSDYRDSETRLKDAITDFAKREGSSQVIVAQKRVDEFFAEAFRYRASFAIVLSDLLKAEGIALRGFYLTDGCSFDYEEILQVGGNS